MTRRLYSFLMWLAQPFLRLKLARRGVREPGYLQAVAERFGHYASEPCQSAADLIWLHAVSLGETRAAGVLLLSLRKRLPGMRLLLTHGTATGWAEGTALLQPGDLQTWQPWDSPAAVRRFLEHFKPRIGILMETEVWPNLAARCQQIGLPLVLANARLSEKSLRWARRLAWLARPAYGGLSAVWAQTQDDALRLQSLGAKVQGVFGNLKFDATPDAMQLANGRAWRARLNRPVVMLASSRAGEEEALLQIVKSLQSGVKVKSAPGAMNSQADDVQWLLVPRHPQRFDEVAAMIEGHGFAVSRRSSWSDGPPVAVGRSGIADTVSAGDNPRVSVWLGDSLGEMALYYALADCALLGGSFEPLGGQNLIEAAACACPLLMGPHTFNFAEAAELAQAAGAAQRVPSMAEAVAVASMLVHDAHSLQAARQAADTFSRTHRGATERLARAIEQMLGETPN